MPIHIDCSVCGQRLRVPNFAAGRITKCTACGAAVRVPQPTALLKEEDETKNAGPVANKNQTDPFSPSEVWYRSIERLSGSLDWLAERPIRILVVALVLVAGYVGVATAKWALSKPVDLTIKSQEAIDLEPWEGVGTSDANDRVRVTAQSVTTEQIAVVPPNMRAAQKTPKAYLRIALKIENLGPSELKYSGWSVSAGNEDHAARLKDDAGVAHKQVVWKARIVGQTSSEVIPPSGSVSDVLVFEPPGTYARYLKLALPAEACEGTGDLRIKLPRTRFID
ncbi:MAG TPA: hypothetical protein VGP76_26870 [Planctomycetaceae bacterium]|jgi:hypothetical protein|nr:hypothetical protein [Planctomycetaceae bacterium]